MPLSLTEPSKAFAERIGCSKGLVSQYFNDSMPRADNGDVPLVAALRWIAANKPNSKTAPKVPELLAALGVADEAPPAAVVPKPQQAGHQAPAAASAPSEAIDHGDQGPDSDIDADSLTEAKRLHEIEKIRRTRIAKEKDRGVLIDRDLVRRGLHEFAMVQRDSWIAWCSRAAPDVAADLGVDLGRAYATLNKLVRQQLIDMAGSPLPPSLKGVADGE